jgi:DNA repair protein RadC
MVSHMADRSLPWPAPSEAGAVDGATLSLAQLLAGGGDPGPQLARAGALLSALGGPGALLRASPEQLAAAGVLEAQEVALLLAVQRVAGAQRPAERPEIHSFGALQRFLRTEMAGAGRVETRALLLEDQHRLKAEVILARRDDPLTHDQHRDLVRSCLEHRACGVIIARWVAGGHPSVLELTREANVAARSLEMLGMLLLDYVLIEASEIRRIRWCPSSAGTPQA